MDTSETRRFQKINVQVNNSTKIPAAHIAMSASAARQAGASATHASTGRPSIMRLCESTTVTPSPTSRAETSSTPADQPRATRMPRAKKTAPSTTTNTCAARSTVASGPIGVRVNAIDPATARGAVMR